uniref:GNAT family N-acetyltransferase n=1 Tax=Candidatus Enterococcus willemsii TaxID=1857215 RepID=UPI00403F258A
MLTRVRVQNDSEIDELLKVIHPIWKEVFTTIIGSAQVAYMLENYQGKQMIQEEIDNGVYYYQLYYDDQAVGYTAYQITADYLYLSKIYIKQEYRGHGLMRQIFDWYDQLSKELSLKQHLRVNQGNELAIAVYKKRGFKQVREDIVDIGEGFQMVDYIFEKNS